MRASEINEEMKLACANALANLISDEELNEDYILPKAFDPRVGETIAKAACRSRKKNRGCKNLERIILY